MTLADAWLCSSLLVVDKKGKLSVSESGQACHGHTDGQCEGELSQGDTDGPCQVVGAAPGEEVPYSEWCPCVWCVGGVRQTQAVSVFSVVEWGRPCRLYSTAAACQLPPPSSPLTSPLLLTQPQHTAHSTPTTQEYCEDRRDKEAASLLHHYHHHHQSPCLATSAGQDSQRLQAGGTGLTHSDTPCHTSWPNNSVGKVAEQI